MDVRLYRALTMAGRKFWCTKCQLGFVVKDGELPATCPHCDSGAWRSANDPKKPYELNFNDKQFLRSIRVVPEDAN